MFDWLIVGAGFAGSVLAERLANELDSRVLLIDRRRHIGGNAYDYFDKSGALVSLYGRHVLQTDDETVRRYLFRFARWQRCEITPQGGGRDLAMTQSEGRQPLVPSEGYSRMFERMLEGPNIKIMLNIDYKEVQDAVAFRRLIYTGSLDDYFEYCYGKLPYWPMETDRTAPHRAPARRYLARDVIDARPEDSGGYPVDAESGRDLYQRYHDLAETAPDVFFTGRLAAYRYCTIDEVVAQSLALFDRIKGDASGDVPPSSAHKMSIASTPH